MAPRLSPRLMAVAAMVPAGHPVVDVGTDHGLLPVYLVGSARSPRVVAVDVAEAPLRVARATVTAAATLGVEVRRSDGLTQVSAADSPVVVMSGMGAQRMLSILRRAAPGTASQALVLQPNTHWPGLRSGVVALGFRIVDEILVEDAGRFYLVLRAEPGRGAKLSVLDREFGPVVRHRRTPEYLAWLGAEGDRLARAIRAAGEASPSTLRASLRRVEAELHGHQPS